MTFLLDLDGVILATEPYYTYFWSDMVIDNFEGISIKDIIDLSKN